MAEKAILFGRILTVALFVGWISYLLWGVLMALLPLLIGGAAILINTTIFWLIVLAISLRLFLRS